MPLFEYIDDDDDDDDDYYYYLWCELNYLICLVLNSAIIASISANLNSIPVLNGKL